MDDLNKQMLSAAFDGNYLAVRKMVEQGANINYTDQWGNFAMFTAAWAGNIEAMDLYYSLGAKISFDEANLLCNAAYNGKLYSVKWLMDKGEDVNFAFTRTGENALHYCISKTSEMDERGEIVKALIAAGIDVHKRTISREPTLCFMRDAFLKGETPLHRAAAYGSMTIIKMLLDAGADPSAKDVNGDTPISWGSWHLRDADVLRMLVYEKVAPIH